jgi:hypothetical protein
MHSTSQFCEIPQYQRRNRVTHCPIFMMRSRSWRSLETARLPTPDELKKVVVQMDRGIEERLEHLSSIVSITHELMIEGCGTNHLQAEELEYI